MQHGAQTAVIQLALALLAHLIGGTKHHKIGEAKYLVADKIKDTFPHQLKLSMRIGCLNQHGGWSLALCPFRIDVFLRSQHQCIVPQ